MRNIQSKTIGKTIAVLKEMKYIADNNLKMDTAGITKRYYTNQAIPYAAKLLGYFESKSPAVWICKKERFDPIDARNVLNYIYDCAQNRIKEKRNIKGQFMKGNIPHNKPRAIIKKEILDSKILQVKDLNQKGFSQREISEQLDISLGSVNGYLNTEKMPVKLENIIPPNIEDVEKYCNERQNDVNPAKFMAYYEQKGWKIGKEKMKNWKMAIHTWEHKNYNSIIIKKLSEYTIQELTDEFKRRGYTGTILPPSNEIKF